MSLHYLNYGSLSLVENDSHSFVFSFPITETVYVTAKSSSKHSSIVLFVTPVADSWWNTVKCCLPDTVQSPSRVQFGQLVHQLMVGELVYPVDIDWNN